MSGKKKWRWGGVGLEDHCARSQRENLRVILTAWWSLRDPTDLNLPQLMLGPLVTYKPSHPDHSRMSPLHKVGTFYKAYNKVQPFRGTEA